MFQEIPSRCIVLLEDIDAVWSGGREQRHTNDGVPDLNFGASTVTLSGLLNVLDGVGSQEGRVVIMTTNKPEKLDSALIRPGRVDFKLHLGNITRKSAEQMFMRMFAPDLLESASSTRGSTLFLTQAASVPDTQLVSLEKPTSMEQLQLLATQFAQ